MPRSTQRDPSAIQSLGEYLVKCYDKDGNLKWSEVAHNALMNEGEFMILDVALRNGTAPAEFYIGLYKNTLAALPAETSTLASLNTAGPYELTNASDAGYSARQTIARDATSSGWPTLALNSGDYMATSKTVSWAATANWADTIRWIFLTTASAVPANTTGKLISIAQLTADRLLLDGDTLDITYTLKLQ